MASLLELEALMKMHNWDWRKSSKTSHVHIVGNSTEKLIETVAKYLRENGQSATVDSLFEQYKPK
jgi:hypothetical protein